MAATDREGDGAPDDVARPPWTRIVGLLVVSLVLAGVAIWIMRAGALPVIPPDDAWTHVDPTIVVGYVGVWWAVLVVRSYRWVWLLAPHAAVSRLRVTMVSLVGLGALVVFPMRLGEIVRPVLLRRHEPVSTWTAFGTVGAERVIDGLFLSCSLLLAMALAPVARDAQNLGEYMVSASVIAATVQVAFAVFAIGLVGLVVAYWKRAWARRVLDRILRPISARLADFATEGMQRLLAGMAFLPHRGYLAAFVGATAVYWLLNGLGLWMLAGGCGIELTAAQGWVVLGLLALGILVPNAPGYFGIFQLSTFLGLSLYVVEDVLVARGAAFVVLLYSVQLGSTLLFALVSWVGLRFTRPDTGEVSPMSPPG